MSTRPKTRRELAARIDHTLLRPDASASEIEALCRDCVPHGFAAVCVAPCWVDLAVRQLAGTPSPAAVAAVVGFPHGNTLPAIKAAEAKRVAELGAREVDMVMNVGWFLDGRLQDVRDDIEGVVLAARAAGASAKVILETGFLAPDQIGQAARLAADAGAAFVKTSTGFGPRGASPDDVKLMKAAVGEAVGIKAAGGIRTLEQALALLSAGATRLGCSSSVAIVEAMPG